MNGSKLTRQTNKRNRKEEDTHYILRNIITTTNNGFSAFHHIRKMELITALIIMNK